MGAAPAKANRSRIKHCQTVTVSLVDEIVREQIYDQSAMTVEELAMGSRQTEYKVWQFARKKVAAGEWERVRKVSADGRTRYAYRSKA